MRLVLPRFFALVALVLGIGIPVLIFCVVFFPVLLFLYFVAELCFYFCLRSWINVNIIPPISGPPYHLSPLEIFSRLKSSLPRGPCTCGKRPHEQSCPTVARMCAFLSGWYFGRPPE